MDMRPEKNEEEYNNLRNYTKGITKEIQKINDKINKNDCIKKVADTVFGITIMPVFLGSLMLAGSIENDATFEDPAFAGFGIAMGAIYAASFASIYLNSRTRKKEERLSDERESLIEKREEIYEKINELNGDKYYKDLAKEAQSNIDKRRIENMPNVFREALEKENENPDDEESKNSEKLDVEENKSNEEIDVDKETEEIPLEDKSRDYRDNFEEAMSNGGFVWKFGPKFDKQTDSAQDVDGQDDGQGQE